MDYLQPLLPLDMHNEALQANVRPRDWTNPKPDGRYNFVVIGAGTAGLVAAAGAAGVGAKVALIERGLMGGDCLNSGCVPSKSLINAARQIALIQAADDAGIRVGRPEIDFPQIMERMRRMRAQLSPHDSAQRFRGLGIDVFFGDASFHDGNTLVVNGEALRFQKACVATGARATVPEIPGLLESGFLTNESLFSLTELPQRLVVLGGGPIGSEMAQCFARFGTQVTLIDSGSQLLSNDEEAAAQLVQSALESDGVKVLLNANVTRITGKGSAREVEVSSREGEARIPCDQLLVSVGRTPNVEGLGLEKVGIEFDLRRGIVVDDFLRTTNRNVFASGDVCSRFKFTHAADFMSRLVIQNALFMGRARVSKLVIPWCTYTSPEVAHVGLYPKQAVELGVELVTYSQPFSSVDRAVLDGNESGYVSVYCRKGSDRILGAAIVGEHAGDMIGEIVMAMKYRIGLKRIASVIHPYPTHTDAIRQLGDQFNRQRLTPLVKSLFEKWLKWGM
ncbi:MAG: mercuric reductase [Planctomycetes bacterium]|nr:mercuric reductase [Planctomycetota bacterium]